MHFVSDNTAGAPPEVWAKLAEANAGNAPSYGADTWTQDIEAVLSRLFGRNVRAFAVASGTAANCLALASLSSPFGAIYAHEEAHVLAHESTAPEFFTQNRLIPVPGPHGRVAAGAFAGMLGMHPRGDVHAPQPGALSLTQATECGTYYRPKEISDLAEIAKKNGVRVHMDGARFANAVAASGLSPAALTWQPGVDALSFGLTKNGALAAEIVVFFYAQHADQFIFHRKRAGHLLSKMRFVSAQALALFEDDVWLRLARHANAMAQRLAQGLRDAPPVTLDIPPETNMVFPLAPPAFWARLESSGARFIRWGSERPDGLQRVRLVASHMTQTQDVDRFVDHARALTRS